MQLVGASKKNRTNPDSLAERVYQQLKDDIFAFRLLPGSRFSEGEIAQRMEASRTPVRLALYRLEREGYLDVHFRSGWQVRPFDFEHFEDLYELRIVLETEAAKRLCARSANHPLDALQALSAIWLVAAEDRLQDGSEVSRLDERFHCQLVEAAGNAAMARVHAQLSEKIRIIRRLDFTQSQRIALTYEEHGAILRAILSHRSDEACRLLKAHIEVSKAEVRKVTLHMLQEAHERAMRA
ncbi:GntR family transcriptional regulator [Pseudomonas sp. S2_E01]